MEELLKLINEYEEEGIIFDEVDDEECFVDIHPCTLWTEYNGHLWFNNANKVQFDKWMFDRVAISKEYGFIKRLVENNKIDRVEVWSTGMTKPTYGYTTEPYTTCKSIKLENTILMVLSIQDEPIEFLISILK